MFVFPNKPILIHSPEILKRELIRGWVAQPKWNGHRAVVVCSPSGKIEVMNRLGQPLARAAGGFKWLSMLDLPRPWVMDGELTAEGKLVIWDVVLSGVYFGPYSERLPLLECVEARDHGLESVRRVEVYAGDNYKGILLRRSDKNLEGIVFKKLDATDLWSKGKTYECPSQVKYRW